MIHQIWAWRQEERRMWIAGLVGVCAVALGATHPPRAGKLRGRRYRRTKTALALCALSLAYAVDPASPATPPHSYPGEEVAETHAAYAPRPADLDLEDEAQTAAGVSSGVILGWGDQVVGVDLSRGFVAVAGGAYHSLGLKADGSIVGWGDNEYGQTSTPAPNTGFIAVAAGASHSLGLKADGSIVAWGCGDPDNYGQCNVPTPNSGFIAVAAGAFHSLGLKADGSIVAWGCGDPNTNYGQCNVPAPNSGFVAVAGGGSHSLGLKSDGSIVGWGFGGYGQTNVPTPNSGFVGIAAGANHSLGLKSDGSIVAWGWNGSGQTNPPGGPNTGFIRIAAGYAHNLGLKGDGSMVAWGCGSYNYGQCSVPSPNTGFSAVAAGGYHNLGLKADGSIVGWGDNESGQSNVPAPNTGFVAIAMDGYHSLGLKADGSVVGWGSNGYGESNVPAPNTGFIEVAAGFYHSLGRKADGSIVAWGSNAQGQTNPPPGGPNTGFIAVAGGGVHSLGLKADGSIVAWGCGQPNTDYAQCNVPAPNTGFIAVAAGGVHSLGLKADGSVVAWGAGGPGQSGWPHYGQSVVPAPNTNFTAVAASADYSLGLKGDGSIVGWGANHSGQTNVPAPNADFIAIAGGQFHGLGLKSDGSIVGWGDNYYGKFSIPAPNTGFIAVAAGSYHSLGLKKDSDSDRVPDVSDNCPKVANRMQSNVDADTKGDLCDPCPALASDICNTAGSAAKEFSPVTGGVLQTPDAALSLAIDPGDVGGDVTISVTEMRVESPAVDILFGSGTGLGSTIAVYNFEPDGQTFNGPVTLTIAQDVSERTPAQRARLTLYFFDAPTQLFVPIPGKMCAVVENPVGVFTATCTAEITHFSTYAMVAPLDTDGDGVFDSFDGMVDNCPTAANPLQEDSDFDGIGDHCDPPAAPFTDPLGGGKNRFVSLTVPPAVTSGPGPLTALRVRLVELQNPVPPNAPQFPAPDFSAYESATCGDAGGCVRWVGPPVTALESQDSPGIGNFHGARLQCTPHYHDWGGEGLVHITGGEIVPSSLYDAEHLSAICMGNEDTCQAVSAPITLTTARSGDIASPFNPPSTTTQPDGLDVAALVAKFKNLPGAPLRAAAQLQANVPDLNGDVDALDITADVDAFKGYAYAHNGPCPCPPQVSCNDVPCANASVCSGGTCVKTCSGGANNALPCINNKHCNYCAGGSFDGLPCDPAAMNPCPGGTCSSDGVCGSGFCRDRCGRCSP